MSIHAPREGSIFYPPSSDQILKNFNPCSPRGEHPVWPCGRRLGTSNFNPCSPRGEHLTYGGYPHFPAEFQSMLPARGASEMSKADDGRKEKFQSMLPARGASLQSAQLSITPSNFNPCSPRGEHHDPRRPRIDQLSISIHAPREGSIVG